MTPPSEIRVLHVPGYGHARVMFVPPKLEAFQALVRGPIQHLPLGEYGGMYIHEEGKYQPGFAHNADADKILAAAGTELLPGDFIVGPAVLIGGYDDGGWDLPVQQNLVDLCETLGLEIL